MPEVSSLAAVVNHDGEVQVLGLVRPSALASHSRARWSRAVWKLD
jgi:hypothetical protein